MAEKETATLLTELMKEVAHDRELGVFTDFSIICEQEVIPVHKVIVCAHSKVLRSACTGPFKESSSNSFEMNEESLPLVRKMVDFFYTADYDENIPTASEDEEKSMSPLQVASRMFALGDQYDIPRLRELSAVKYSNRLGQSIHLTEFLKSIPDVYGLTPGSVRELRDRAVRFGRLYLSKVVHYESLKEVWNEVAVECPEFTKEVLEMYMRNPLIGNCAYQCGSHKEMEATQVRCSQCGRGMNYRPTH